MNGTKTKNAQLEMCLRVLLLMFSSSPVNSMSCRWLSLLRECAERRETPSGDNYIQRDGSDREMKAKGDSFLARSPIDKDEHDSLAMWWEEKSVDWRLSLHFLSSYPSVYVNASIFNYQTMIWFFTGFSFTQSFCLILILRGSSRFLLKKFELYSFCLSAHKNI